MKRKKQRDNLPQRSKIRRHCSENREV